MERKCAECGKIYNVEADEIKKPGSVKTKRCAKCYGSKDQQRLEELSSLFG